MYNRNSGREIGARLVALRDFLFSNADKTRAVSMKDIQREYTNRGFTGKHDVPPNIKTVYNALTVSHFRSAGSNPCEYK